MYKHTLHILLVAFALSMASLSVMAGKEVSAATQFHNPKQQQAAWTEMFQENKTQPMVSKQKNKKHASHSSAAMPTNQRVGSTVSMPSFTGHNPLLNRQIAVQPSATNAMPQMQMYSVAARLRETHKAPTTNTAASPTFAVNESSFSTSIQSATITAVGASEAAPMYSVVTPTIRRKPPDTGGGDPVNPDIPVPVGSGVWLLLLTALLYATRIYIVRLNSEKK